MGGNGSDYGAVPGCCRIRAGKETSCFGFVKKSMSSHNARKGTEKENKMLPVLQQSREGLILTDGNLTLMADFVPMIPRLKQGVLGTELLVRAAKWKKMRDGKNAPTLIDATAGLGEDSMLLAAAGFSVQMYEQNPIIAALLEDALNRAAAVPELSEFAARMELLNADSIAAMRNLHEAPDVIYLDPMFPERKKSALIKKKFQLLGQLEMPCANEEELLGAAIAAHPHKIVIKRPAKGPYLAGIKADYSISGKTIRYDCLVFP